jgi:hypothetical protein
MRGLKRACDRVDGGLVAALGHVGDREQRHQRSVVVGRLPDVKLGFSTATVRFPTATAAKSTLGTREGSSASKRVYSAVNSTLDPGAPSSDEFAGLCDGSAIYWSST